MTLDAGLIVPVVVFDGDCGFCTWSVSWAQRWIRPDVTFMPWQRADLVALGLTPQECASALQFVQRNGRVESGGRAVCALLTCGRAPWPWVGRLGSVVGVRRVVDGMYRLVARHRHRLPGATPACALPG